MKRAILLYREFYELPEDLSDLQIMFEMISLLLFFFTLGFFMSQIIVYLVR